MVAPILASTGFNTKVLYGMAAGVPVVATHIAVRGLELTDEQLQFSVTILDHLTPQSFAASVLHLFHDRSRWQEQLSFGLNTARVLSDNTRFHQDIQSVVTSMVMESNSLTPQ